MRTMRIGLFVGATFSLVHQVAGEQLALNTESQGCVPSNETASGLACPAPPGLDNTLALTTASVTRGLTQTSDPALMGDRFDWAVLGASYTGVASPTPPVPSGVILNNATPAWQMEPSSGSTTVMGGMGTSPGCLSFII